MIEIYNLLAVLFSITITVVLPPLFSVIWLNLGGQWSKNIFASLVLGLSSQSVIGLLWNHLVSKDPGLEVLLYYLFWLILFLVIMVFHKKSLSMKIDRQAITGISMIIGLLIVAVIVRSIHPLQHFALGQSDAYSHLNFLRDIMETGAIENKMYPPGYHWVLALPVLSFHLDPYYVARYVGAFFGAGLVLAVFVLVEELAGRKAAYLSAFGVACFPGFYLLLKTGVGAFANQMGLVLIPVALYYYIRVLKDESVLSSYNLIFILALLGLAASVPMMLLHILIIICMERVLSLLYRSNGWLIQTIGITLSSLPAIFIVAYHFLRTGEQAQKVNIQILNEGLDKASPVLLAKLGFWDLLNQPLLRSVLDFLSIKRWGFGNIFMDSIGFLLLIVFLALLLYSISKRRHSLVIVALWGVVASTQAITGFLQFSAYQREGWSLLIVIACLSGMLMAHIYKRWIVQRIILQWCFFICIFIVSLISLIFPPAHRFYASAAEDDIIKIVRGLTDQSIKKLPFGLTTEVHGREILDIRNNLSEHLPIVIVSRNFSSWGSGQGELIKVVMHRNTSIRYITVTDQTSLDDVFKKENQYLIVMDKEREIGLQDLGIASRLSRFNARQFVIAQSNLLQTNKKIEDYLNHLSSGEWNLHRLEINDNLTIKILNSIRLLS
jgi:hypothetical protein